MEHCSRCCPHPREERPLPWGQPIPVPTCIEHQCEECAKKAMDLTFPILKEKDAKIRELEEKLAETSSWDEVCALSMKRWGENLALTTEAGTNQIRNAALDEVIGPLFAYFNSVPYSGCSPHDLAARIRALKK